MSAALSLSKYLYFDTLEIVSEPDHILKPYQAVKPIKAGNVLPDFTLEKENAKWQRFLNGAEIQGQPLLRQLLNKPLVIGFYSKHWQAYGLEFLKQLNAIQHDIMSHGGNLLIISAEKERSIEKIVWEQNLSLNFYFDTDKEIAQKFRIYSDEDPIWNRFSGIDTNVPVLATYVISPAGQILYDHVDLNFEEPFPVKNIIGAVQRAASSDTDNRIININEAVGS